MLITWMSFLLIFQYSIFKGQCSFYCNGDGEIRTLDPLLARQVLSQLSYAPSSSFSPLTLPSHFVWGSPRFETPPLPHETGFAGAPLKGCLGLRHLSERPQPFHSKIRQPPTLPYRLQYSTIGRQSLNHRVRDENGCVPLAHRHLKAVH